MSHCVFPILFSQCHQDVRRAPEKIAAVSGVQGVMPGNAHGDFWMDSK